MIAHAAEWSSVGDFADDAALGILLFVIIPIALVTWYANRKERRDPLASPPDDAS